MRLLLAIVAVVGLSGCNFLLQKPASAATVNDPAVTAAHATFTSKLALP